MPYFYLSEGGGSVSPFVQTEQIKQADKPAKWTCAKNGTLSSGNYWGIYNAQAVPIMFDADTLVDGFGVNTLTAEPTWVGGRARVGIYTENTTTGMPQNRVWDAGVVTSLGKPGVGVTTNDAPATTAVLSKGVRYWLITHLIAEDGSGSPAPAAEYFSGECTYSSFLNSGNEPMFSMGYATPGDLAFNYGQTPTGLYCQPIVDFGWDEGTAWPATLTGTLNSSFYPSAASVVTYLSVSENV